MISEAELIVDRRRLRRRLTWWRLAALALAALAVLALLWTPAHLGGYDNHIARIRIDGLITGDRQTLKLLEEISEAERVKALIVRIDSPGGTTSGSEAIYAALRDIAKTKPVVAVMDTVAASGGYITAIAADHIVARGNTITGSIGVIFQWAEVSKLLETIGVNMQEIKSGDLKAEPSPYTPVTEKARAAAMLLVEDAFNWFIGLVAERRKLPLDRVRVLSDGRVYTGRQALEVGLVDALGGEEAAVAWLAKERNISADSEIVDWKASEGLGISDLGFALGSGLLKSLGLDHLEEAGRRVKLDGLLVLWHPSW